MKAIFFLTLGRSGTTWLYRTIDPLYKKYYHLIKKEPLLGGYRANQYFRNFGPNFILNEKINNHLNNIIQILKNNNYMEVGWNCFSALPLFIEILTKLGHEVKIIHIPRHPVTWACSFLVHHFHEGRYDEWEIFNFLTTQCKNIKFPNFCSDWNSLSGYEKMLFQWLEVNSYAIELQKKCIKAKYFTIKYEQLFNNINKVFDFIDLPMCKEVENRIKIKDYPVWRTSLYYYNIDMINNYPEIIKLARQLNYNALEYNKSYLENKYLAKNK